MIFYFCPDVQLKSSGIRLLYRHVEILVKHGYRAAILHHAAGFSVPDMPHVPTLYLSIPNAINTGDIVVVPEGFPGFMAELAPLSVRRIVICLSWSYVYSLLPERTDWRTHKIERVLTNSSFVGDFVSWAMGLPVQRFQWGMNPRLYCHPSEEKIAQIAYVARKQGSIRELRQALWSRNPEFLDRIVWLGLEGQTEADYARAVRRSSIFLNLSAAEGLPCAALEAMRSGTLVAGFNSVGGQRELIGSGDKQNCVLAENQDYVTLARQLEGPLVDLLARDMTRWSRIRDNALATSAAYTPEAEEASVVSMWQSLIG